MYYFFRILELSLQSVIKSLQAHERYIWLYEKQWYVFPYHVSEVPSALDSFGFRCITLCVFVLCILSAFLATDKWYTWCQNSEFRWKADYITDISGLFFLAFSYLFRGIKVFGICWRCKVAFCGFFKCHFNSFYNVSGRKNER